ncbi:hypothetical protein FQA39_LY03486 [Lamprigera yunnana]|nr:hypothetical protein FQA39_LY03486 [Lamprigera yunnana]
MKYTFIIGQNSSNLRLYNVILKNVCNQINIQCVRYHVSFLSPLDTNTWSARYLQTNQWDNQNTPDLIYIPQIIRWLRNKFKFKLLKRKWDPEFSEGAFIYGSIKAVCKISDVIHDDKPEDLNGLLTEAGKKKLVRDMTTKLTHFQKTIIKISPKDIKILVPTTVNLKTDGDKKECEISLRSLALKLHEEYGNVKLVLVALQTDFVRDYSEGVKPQWIVSMYNILECTMLSESPTAW